MEGQLEIAPSASDAQEAVAGPADDAALVERARTGEVDAFEALLRRHHERVHRVVWRMVGDAEAEDAVREVFLSAQRTLACFPTDLAFSTWLLRIASSQAQSSVSKRRPGPAKHRPEIASLGTTPDPGSERPLLPDVARALLEESYERLHSDLRSALAVQLEGADYEEIAQIVAAPVWTVRSRIFRAREALANAMQERRAGRG